MTQRQSQAFFAAEVRLTALLPYAIFIMKNKPEVRKLNFLSLTFLLFFALTLLAYYLVPKRWQNILLLVANYVFYMWQNPVFGALLLSGTAVGYGCAIAVGKGKRKKLWLAVCAVYSFGLLFIFK